MAAPLPIPPRDEPTTKRLPAVIQPPPELARLLQSSPRVPRYRPARPSAEVTLHIRAITTELAPDPHETQALPLVEAVSLTPTRPRLVALRFCYQCGAAVPPWRDACADHNPRQAGELPPLPRLVPRPQSSGDIADAATGIQFSVTRRREE